MPQHNEFLNNNYPYPAQPRNQWELGFTAGASYIIGDVMPKLGIGGGISLRKSLNHIFSVRGSYLGSINSGDPNSYGLSVGQEKYKTKTHSANLDLVVSLNTLSNYRGNPKTNVYVFGGYALIGSQVTVTHANGVENIFYGIGQPNSQNGLLTTIFGNTVNGRKGWAVMQGFTTGGGIAFKLNNKVNLGLEQRLTFISQDMTILMELKMVTVTIFTVTLVLVLILTLVVLLREYNLYTGLILTTLFTMS
jgi:hypothetical protein